MVFVYIRVNVPIEVRGVPGSSAANDEFVLAVRIESHAANDGTATVSPSNVAAHGAGSDLAGSVAAEKAKRLLQRTADDEYTLVGRIPIENELPFQIRSTITYTPLPTHD